MKQTQRGLALVAVLAMLALGASWYLISALNSASTNRTTLDRQHNARILTEAKFALLGWAAKQAADAAELNPGRLPCAEAAAYNTLPINVANEGTAAANCGSGTEIGRLPWRTLGISKLLDASGEPLWYIASDGWKLNLVGTPLGINSNKAGQLGLDGAANVAVAIIIAPGRAMSLAPTSAQSALGCAARTQTRHSRPANYLDYVECQNIPGASLRSNVAGNESNTVFNDQFVVVTAAEVLAAIEGAVAARMESQVVPQIQSVYATSDWGATPTNPIYPFAAPFASTAASDFEGTAGTTQGLLPITAAGSTVSGSQNSTFIAWDTAVTGIVKYSGTGVLGAYTCTGTSTLSCTVNYGCDTVDFTFLGVQYCSTSNFRVAVSAFAANVGMSFRTFNTSYTVSGFNSLARLAPYSEIQSNGSARLIFRGTWSGSNWCVRNNLSCQSRTFTVPISAFSDHPFLSPSVGDAWYWFFANNWHHVTYYAVAPSHAPSGATHNCSTVGDCLTVNGGKTATGNKAILMLTGRSLSNATRPSATLSDYLDNNENRNLDTAFSQDKFGKTYNDRFVTISNY